MARNMMASAMSYTVCEGCFFQAVANLKQERRSQALFSDDGRADRAFVGEDFGLIARDDFFNDSFTIVKR